MLTTYTRFSPSRPLSQYVGQAGSEATREKLTSAAYDALAASKMSRTEPELVVIGEYHREDGATFLDFGVPQSHVESTTDFRWDREARRYRLLCPLCGWKDGKHTKGCDRA